jgi:hypothetical protein
MSRPNGSCATPPWAMPPAASRCCRCTTPSPTTATCGPSLATDRWLPLHRRPAVRVGIRAVANPPSTPWAAWSPTASRMPPPTGPGSWPGGPATPRPTSAWPPATPSTSWTSTAPSVPRPSGPLPPPVACTARGRWSAPVGVAGISIWPHRPRQRPPDRAGACRLARPGWLCGRPTQPPRLRPALPVGRRPRPGYAGSRGPLGAVGAAGAPTATAASWPNCVSGRRRPPRWSLRPGRAGRGAVPGRHRPGRSAQPPAVGVDPQPLQPGRGRRPRPLRGRSGTPSGG